MKYMCEVSVEKWNNPEGETFWAAYAKAWSTVYSGIRSCVDPMGRIATVDDRPVDIGEPWPDPTTPVGLERLLAIAERLAVTEWERRFGGAK